MLLSIGMIVKNEEKYLDKCLSALVPILHELESELIIVDTGSTDNTVEIAKKYSDKVYPFEWCDDFAAARNLTLDKATGKWYMYIDADEILQDATEIIEFFKSGSYKKYDCANLLIRNMSDEIGTSYTDFQPYRLYAIDNSTRFVGKIHEYIPCQCDKKTLNNTILIHYGYAINNNKELAQKKSDRNIHLLLEELKSNPNNVKTYIQISESYSLANKIDDAIRYAIKGLKLAKKTKSKHIYALFSDIVSMYTIENQYENAMKYINEYFSSDYCNTRTDIDMYYNKLLLHYNHKQYKECIEIFSQYKKVYNYFTKNNYSEDMQYHFTKYSTLIYYNNAKLMACQSYIEIGDFDNAYKLIQNIDYCKLVRTNFIIDMKTKLEFKIIDALHNFDRINELFNEISILNDKQINIISTSYIIYYCIKYKYSLSYIVNNLDLALTKQYINILFASYKDFLETVANYNYPPDNNVKTSFMLASIYEQILDYINDTNKIFIYKIFKQYTLYLKSYMNLIYNSIYLIEENLCVYPKIVEYAYYCIKAMDCLDVKDYTQCFSYLKLALEKNPGSNQIINYLLDYIDEINSPTNNSVSEFDKLANTIKNNILYYIEKNELDVAQKILDEYKTINPNDTDIKMLENKIQIN